MSCLTRTELETSIDAAFGDLIENTALACEQVNTEGKHNLWAMGGMLKIVYNSGTGENTITWRSASEPYTAINLGTIDFNPTSGNATSIRLNYPTQYATNVNQQVCPVAVQATMVPALINGGNSADYGYKVSATANLTGIDITLSRYMPLTALVSYGTVPGWAMSGISPLPSNAYSGSAITYTSGTGNIRITRDHRGLPTLQAIDTLTTTGVQYTPVIVAYTDAYIDVKMLNETTGAFYTGAEVSGWRFGVNYGFADSIVNHRTTNFGSGIYININGLFQTRELPL